MKLIFALIYIRVEVKPFSSSFRLLMQSKGTTADTFKLNIKLNIIKEM